MRFKQAVHGPTHHVVQLAHRYLNPNPRAMMPRSISRVPPRREKDGDICSRLPKVRAKSLSSSQRKPASVRVWTTVGNICSKLLPKSLTIAASTAGSFPALNWPATDNDI